jgi:hypothetical protein
MAKAATSTAASAGTEAARKINLYSPGVMASRLAAMKATSAKPSNGPQTAPK